MHVNTDKSANPHESGQNSAPLIERHREPVSIMHFPFKVHSQSKPMPYTLIENST